MNSIGTLGLWSGFFVFLLLILIIDISCFGYKSQRVSVRQAMAGTFLWITAALVFNFLLWKYLQSTIDPFIANQKSIEFFTGYIIEETLSVDNMFAFLLIFNYFAVPLQYQRRVLLFGIMGAIVMRLVMILAGTWLIAKLHWILYLFGIFLFVTGIKMIFTTKDPEGIENNFLLNWIKRHVRFTDSFHEEHFFIRRDLKWYATPLFLTLVMIELTDLVFALDSIPAIFAITRDPFIVFTSNIFAIMGLRALYFLLRNMADRFYLLKYGVALILVFIGSKMLIEPWFKIPIVIALSVVLTLLAATILLSLLARERKTRKDRHGKSH